MADVQTSATRYDNMSELQVAEVKKYIETFAKNSEYFDKFCEHEDWKKGTKTIRYKKLVRPKVRPEDVVPSKEGIAPRPTKIAYATFEKTIENYNERFNYTDEAAEYSFSNVIADGSSTLAYKVSKKLDFIKGRPFISSRARIEAKATITETMRLAKAVLKKNEAKPWEEGHFLMMTTSEIVEKLEDELVAKGSSLSLDEATKKELLNQGFKKKYGFLISECPSELFYNGDEQYIVFIGRTPEGKMPITVSQFHGVEVFHNPLGSGVIADEDGKITDDANKQLGSIAMKVLGLGAAVNDDLCVIVCKFKADEVKGSELGENGRTGFVSADNGKTKLTLKAVDTNGKDVAAAFVVKDGDTAVTGTSGVYELEPTKVYSYTATLSGYKTVSGKLVAGADNSTMLVVMSKTA